MPWQNANCVWSWKKNEKIPDQKEKLTSTPTMRWVFQTFEKIDILAVWVNGQPTLRQVLNLRPVHQQIIRLLGSHVRNCYFLDS
jgi:hypothetical protein